MRLRNINGDNHERVGMASVCIIMSFIHRCRLINWRGYVEWPISPCFCPKITKLTNNICVCLFNFLVAEQWQKQNGMERESFWRKWSTIGKMESRGKSKVSRPIGNRCCLPSTDYEVSFYMYTKPDFVI